MQSHLSPRGGFWFYPLQACSNLASNGQSLLFKLQRNPRSGFWFYPLQACSNLASNGQNLLFKLQRNPPAGVVLSISIRQYLSFKFSKFSIKLQRRKNICGILFSTVAIALITFSNVHAQSPSTNARPVERITIMFEEGMFHLLSRKNLRKVIPRSDELPSTQSELSGFWYELQAQDRFVLYRRFMPNPICNVFEGPDTETSNAGRTPDRIESIPQSQVFTLLIPRPPADASLVFFGSPIEEGIIAQPASELVRIALDSIIPK